MKIAPAVRSYHWMKTMIDGYVLAIESVEVMDHKPCKGSLSEKAGTETG